MRCIVDGCEKPQARGHQYCAMHRGRLRRHGSTEPFRGCHAPPAERYERFVLRSDSGCWAWGGTTNNRGYGKIGHLFGHRVSYTIHHGPIPDGMHVLHRCDNPPCTNPEHLFLGTHADNMADAARKGLLDGPPARGQKLTIAQAREIRRLYLAGTPREELSDRFGIHVDTVRRIGIGKLWAAA